MAEEQRNLLQQQAQAKAQMLRYEDELARKRMQVKLALLVPFCSFANGCGTWLRCELHPLQIVVGVIGFKKMTLVAPNINMHLYLRFRQLTCTFHSSSLFLLYFPFSFTFFFRTPDIYYCLCKSSNISVNSSK